MKWFCRGQIVCPPVRAPAARDSNHFLMSGKERLTQFGYDLSVIVSSRVYTSTDMTPFRARWSRLPGVAGPQWGEDLRRDLRHTLRSFAKNPGFATVVVLTLGLGIGATTAVFSVVNAVVLRPLNAPNADRLVRSLSINNGRSTDMPSAYTLRVWKDLRDVFEDVSAHRLDSVPLMGRSEPEQISVGRVSEPFFRLFAAPVIAGRTFNPEEDRPNGPAVAMLSYGLWVRRFWRRSRYRGTDGCAWLRGSHRHHRFRLR